MISNCVINLSGDKPAVLREAARVLKPGGRFAVTDVVADADMDDATRADMQAFTGCIAGALTREALAAAITDAGLVEIELQETHRVHASAASTIVRARKPETEIGSATACCTSSEQETCCEPAAKSCCCGAAAERSSSCGCR